MKVKGSELQRFMDEAWPGEDWYWDHEEFDYEPDPDETYDTDAVGPLMYQGTDPSVDRDLDLDLGALIRKWRKARDYDVVTVLVPKDKAEEFKNMVKSIGLKLG